MKDNKIIHELIRMHTIRIDFYHERMLEVNDIDHNLMMLFEEMEDDSKRYCWLLVEGLKNMGEAPEKQIQPDRNQHKWRHFLRNLFFKRDRASILNECEFLEEALQLCYQAAVDTGIRNDEMRQLVIRQQQALRVDCENIRFLIESRRVPLRLPFEWSRANVRSLVN